MKIYKLVLIPIMSIFFVECTNYQTDYKRNLILNNETDVDDLGLEFIRTAALGGMMEVQLSKLALQKSKNQSIKQFAQMLVNDHTKINQELYHLARNRDVLMPQALNPNLQQRIQAFKQMSSEEFDLNYVKMMIGDHQKAISNYENGVLNRREDLKEFASKKLPILKSHLNEAKKLHGSL